MLIQFLRAGPSGAAVRVPQSSVEEFSWSWPCFGATRDLYIEFAANGDLIDLDGDAGMDENGVSAIISDVKAIVARYMGS